MLGIEEDDEPVDIKYLVDALAYAMKRHPDKKQFYKTAFKDVYDELEERINYE